ncbi:hypothetical protein SAICODRAFT_66972 [Saitoella complicata NRRL Y-17804]|nr:uncharacterized protein SAICODRAFT_66972 [Saitoella complicata NRRL Y-17804]ODQ51362.1 hypothetical protein SAICODRAFT_66972 [Saitoella complicata NRRL Y-17804]
MDSSSEQFYEMFQAERQALQTQIDSLSVLTTTERPPAIEQTLARIARLNSEFNGVSTQLAGYDRKQCTEQLKSLSESLTRAQTKLAPKPRFSFKNRGSKISSSASKAADTESEGEGSGSTPSHPRPPAFTTSLHSTLLSSEFHTYLTLPTPSLPDIDIASLTSCIINLHPLPNPHDTSNPSRPRAHAVLTARELRESVAHLGEVTGPAHLTGIRGCTLAVSCHQFRMHDSHDTIIYLRCASKPIIENCSGLRFAPWPFPTSNNADFSPMVDLWDQVEDFNWLKKQHSPHWSILPEEERKVREVWEEVVTLGEDGDVQGGLRKLLPAKVE